jgi:hypothetical protein
VWRLAGFAVGIAFSSNGVAIASPCHEIWNLPADQVQLFQAPSVDNPRSLRVPLPATADAHFHFTFTGTAVTARNVVPYGSGPVARFVEQVNLSAVHGVRFDGQPLKLKLIFGPAAPGLRDATAVAAPATVSSNDDFILGVDAAELWVSPASDLMLDLCVAVAGTSSTVARIAYQVEVLADSNLFLERLRPGVDVLRRGDSTRATVKLAQPAEREMHVAIATSDPALIEVPRAVTIPAGRDSAEFEIRCVGDPKERTAVEVLAIVEGAGQTARIWVEPSRKPRQ